MAFSVRAEWFRNPVAFKQVDNGLALVGEGAGFAVRDELPLSKAVSVEGVFTIRESEPSDNWRVGAVAVVADHRNFRHLGVVVLGVDHTSFRGHWCEKPGYAPYRKKNEKECAVLEMTGEHKGGLDFETTHRILVAPGSTKFICELVNIKNTGTGCIVQAGGAGICCGCLRHRRQGELDKRDEGCRQLSGIKIENMWQKT